MRVPSAGFWDEWPAGLSLYAGAALAVGLFERFPPTIVAWFRVAAAGVVLLVVVRPARWGWGVADVRGPWRWGKAFLSPK